MKIYRLSKAMYAKDLSGLGAEKFGGRWNSQGIPMIYTSQSRALCIAEIAVHTPMGILPNEYVLITLDIPGHAIYRFPLSGLPKDWKAIPPAQSTRWLGDKFVQANKSLAMKVPSVIVEGECNILINPRHPRIQELKITLIEPFDFDQRLFIR